MLTENKHVSVLFADVCDSTALLQHSDPEEARNYLGKALNQLAEAVETYGGTVSQLLGDGLVALFGAPLAQEDHALRACLAALKMQRATVPGHDVQGVASPTLRIGINSGEVLVGVNTIGRTTEQMARRFTLRPGSKRWHRPAAF
ncbi:adenylate/guanylate cyclase domain-containing protein [Bradyrhizobium diazoefficiens]|uniref:adenylate/guanylate cyclase domain-containing protein n=1 Tax=Bradyrhizobium diazoefficiens TaxID=1355477 RepID=UPI0027297BDE|nr:adenylate/guanylate cyclase domain-containing protein [Bradyrhizobium diazoefficiens]WLA68721.1 adenylate/guanylate cyclase domain-containing protein [Bradyrhizobium diazoefficiens]